MAAEDSPDTPLDEADAGVQFAEKIGVSACTHGHVQVHLHDAAGAVFAVGSLDPDSAEALAGVIVRAARTARAGAGASGARH